MPPRLFCEQDLRLVRTLPGSRSELRSALSEPRVVGQPRLVPAVPVKMHAVVSGPGEGATLELAGKISAPALLNVADEELLLLTPEPLSRAARPLATGGGAGRPQPGSGGPGREEPGHGRGPCSGHAQRELRPKDRPG
ncbi:hypothetical protein G6F59_015556 [Rhizopus arrhizus]|nr:hypothetical protein G6F59_015556 [Rhizopus arrhizus]